MFGSQSADVRARRWDLMLVLMVDLQQLSALHFCLLPKPLDSILGLTRHKPVIHYINHKKVNLREKGVQHSQKTGRPAVAAAWSEL